MASMAVAHLSSKASGFDQYTGNASSRVIFNLFRTSWGSAGKSPNPLGVHYRSTLSPKKTSRANLIAKALNLLSINQEEYLCSADSTGVS